MLRTKIICTLGPATDDEDVLRALIKTGMNVARMNFSHGDYPEHIQRIKTFKRIRSEYSFPVALMLDTKGPEVRIGTFINGETEIVTGQTFTLTTQAVEGTNEMVSVSYAGLPNDLRKGNSILIDDGLLEMVVDRIESENIICTVVNGGPISDQKSIYAPGVMLHIPYMRQQDRDDLLFGIEHDIDFVSASFVSSPDNVLELKDFLAKHNGSHINVIAKIESQLGVDNIDAIITASDGIMVARGDMGVEIPFENLPSIQKSLVKKCYSAGKRVIVATQMLDSMMRNPRPTRAETTDVANAIYDGTSAIMLSGETAAGKYPVESLKTMVKIAKKTESDIHYRKRFDENNFSMHNTTDAISHATCTTAHDLNAAAIITVTESGHTARMVSKFRPDCPIIAAAVNQTVWRQLALSWGVYPIMADIKCSTDDLFDHVVERALDAKLIKNGDLVVITGGVPLGVSGTTNILKVQIADSQRR